MEQPTLELQLENGYFIRAERQERKTLQLVPNIVEKSKWIFRLMYSGLENHKDLFLELYEDDVDFGKRVSNFISQCRNDRFGELINIGFIEVTQK